MADKTSIFDLADKFGFVSPFGDWVKEDFKQVDIYKPKIVSILVSKSDKQAVITNPNSNKIPIYIIITAKIEGEENIIVDISCDGGAVPNGNIQINNKKRDNNTGILSYEVTKVFYISVDKNAFQPKTYTASVQITSGGKITDKKENKFTVDTNGNISDDDRTNKESCGIEYRNKVKCTKYNGVYGPVHWGTLTLKKYPNWDKLIKGNYITNDEKDILIGMSKNEGKIDGVQSYDSEVVTVGAMQKTLKNNGQGQFYTQVLEFKNQNKTLYEDLFEKCGWKIENNKLTYNNLSGQALKDLIRKGFNKDVYGLSIPSIPLEPLIKACHNSEFQKKQILDFIDALNTVLEFYPVGYSYKIEEYFQSNFSKAVILDQYVNRPNYVKTDLGGAMDRFFAKHPSYSKSPDNWGNNQSKYELEIMEDYGKNRRGTDMVNRYNNLKEYFLK